MKMAIHRLVPGAALVLVGVAGPAHALVHPFTQVPAEGSQETPPVTTTGSGVMDSVYNDSSGAIYWYVEYTLDSGSTDMIGAHFHGPAPAGTPAGIKIDLNNGSFPLGQSGLFSGNSMVLPADNADVLNGLWYINLHSNVHTGGELRGQMVPGPFTHYFDSDPIEGSQETPPVTTSATGTIDAAYDADTNTLTFGLEWANLSTTINGMHFHVAPAGTPGGIVVDFATLGTFPTTTTGAFAGSVVLTDPQETDLLAGNFYVNIHTTMHSGGEIRGQLNPILVSTSVADWYIFE